MTLKKSEIRRNIQRWQKSPYVHHLTCGNEKCRADLLVEERDEKLILVCPECNYVQTWIPDFLKQSGLVILGAK